MLFSLMSIYLALWIHICSGYNYFQIMLVKRLFKIFPYRLYSMNLIGLLLNESPFFVLREGVLLNWKLF